ncbi:hypothetical protein N7522_000241 [Penicillium canescens]|uniref:uncharacterized protein n=1 Tax=Penicillium canescens TaxID=5083 RepID=UPI0026E09F85|nr:uncharacterized protein N7446_012384 [Penicillium canescens]KAJ6020166.1 hypothetical protein N7522_000241 [Penicillium canescens]KAJ6045520.1 hypothetical protein N7446_012384 [Penicillium canescens]
MYESTWLDLHRLSRHSLQERYESDEEAVSESDTGAQDLLSSPMGSPVESQRAAIFDSDLSADDASHMDPDSDREEYLLAPPAVKRPRPVSTDTIKRTSNAAFDDNAYVFDPEEQMVLELPSPDSPPQLASSIFLQPSVYVSPKPKPTTRSRSTLPSSIFSVEEADIQVAKKVTFMEPQTRPTVVLINALGKGPSSGSRSNHSRSQESSRSRPRLATADNRLASSRSSEHISKRHSYRETTPKPAPWKQSPIPVPAPDDSDERTAPSATINRVSEVLIVPSFPEPSRTIPTNGKTNEYQYIPRPRTAGADRTMPPPLHIPPPPTQTTRTPSRGLTAPFILLLETNTRFVSSSYSVSNILTHRSPLMMRRMTRKHSSSSVHSMSSLRSEIDTVGPSSSQVSVATQPVMGSGSGSMVDSNSNANTNVVRKST